ncbi:MarR family transcriptional regulator [Pseudaminobacter arsenicus]|uniref:MarR family transcriptional regulator n=1 Tax=Borborobacter arsenicus TaxID=1851146 RepID=A0A432V4D7_9HYPH|nr:MarR family transcriptional regulator [Pseudaminobacter arsenicus]RUM97015.1 MarR family transcriptional regulator [Pseudaminobacter arsenicus]
MEIERDDNAQIAAGLVQLVSFLRMSGWRDAAPLGLTPTQGACLSLLENRGPNRVTVLAKLLGVTQATASDVIAALERKRLVIRQADPDDGRAIQVRLTQEGRVLAARMSAPPAPLAKAVEALDDKESAGMRRALSKIILELQEAGAIEPQRLCLTCRFFQPYKHSDAVRPHHCAFVDAAFGDASLRLDCNDHADAGSSARLRAIATAPKPVRRNERVPRPPQ